MLTINGIYTDIEESTYIYELFNYTFYFSSKVYLKKFIEGVFFYIKSEKIKLINKYKVPFNDRYIDIYLAKAFYKKIEKRGFKVELKKDKK